MDNDKNPRARGRDLMGDGYSYTSNTLRSRARACEDFYGAAIAREVDAAVDYALELTLGDTNFRRAWCFYCLRLGINTFLDQLESVMGCYRQGELRKPASAFHARLRQMLNQVQGANGKGGAR